MTLTLILVAHGSTEATARAAFPLDESLDVHALAKAGAAAGSLGKVDRAWCGPSRRAVETATALALQAKVEPELRDCDFGSWAGRSHAEVAATAPEALAMWMGDPSATPHGGESVEDLIQRVGAWIDRKRANHGRVVAVTHPAVIRAAAVHVLAAGAAAFWQFDVLPLTQSIFLSNGKRWVIAATGQPIGPSEST